MYLEKGLKIVQEKITRKNKDSFRVKKNGFEKEKFENLKMFQKKFPHLFPLLWTKKKAKPIAKARYIYFQKNAPGPYKIDLDASLEPNNSF